MSTLEAVIREARSEDYPQVCRLLDALDELHRERAPWMFKAPEYQPRSEGYFASLVDGEHSAVLVADAGPLVGIAPWMAVVVADLVLAVALRWFPVRSVPVGIAVAVAAVAVLLDPLVPGGRLAALVDHTGVIGAVAGALTAAALTSVVDNLPALLALLPAVDHTTVMPVLLGVNAGAGVIFLVSEHVGIRGDARYFRSLQDVDFGDLSVSLGSLDFWRAYGGLTFSF